MNIFQILSLLKVDEDKDKDKVLTLKTEKEYQEWRRQNQF